MAPTNKNKSQTSQKGGPANPTTAPLPWRCHECGKDDNLLPTCGNKECRHKKCLTECAGMMPTRLRSVRSGPPASNQESGKGKTAAAAAASTSAAVSASATGAADASKPSSSEPSKPKSEAMNALVDLVERYRGKNSTPAERQAVLEEIWEDADGNSLWMSRDEEDEDDEE